MKLLGELSARDYGIVVFSPDLFNEYVKINKWKAKKLITFFNKDKDKFLQIIKDGILVPFYLIPSYEYNIFLKVNKVDKEMPKGYKNIYQYNNFYIEIGKNNKLCIASFAFLENNVDLIRQNITEKSETIPSGPNEIMEQYNFAFGFELDAGKYNFNLIGLEKEDIGERESKNFGYLLEFMKNENAKNDNFNKCDNDKNEFSIIKHLPTIDKYGIRKK